MNSQHSRLRRLLCAVVAVLAAVSAVITTAAAIQSSPPILKVAALLNYSSGKPEMTAEEIVAQLSSTSPDASAIQLAARLQHPKSAALLITKRLPPEYRATLPNDDPDEILQRYVVLEYNDTQTTLAAKAALQRDSLFSYVVESTFAQFSTTPADPLYPAVGQVQNFQWGMNDPLNFKPAWTNVRGIAYIADLDNGIQNGNPNSAPATPLHEDLGQPWRPRWNFNVADGGNDVDEHPELVNGHSAGHGTHTAGIIAAATSQSSVAPGYPNPPAVGVAGSCWYCSLMIVKISRIILGAIDINQTVDVPNAINWAATSGAQVLNMSFGGPDQNCPMNSMNPYCAALASAQLKEVVIAAAAGNSNFWATGTGNALGTVLDFPAVSTYTIAVGGIQSYSGVRGNLWTEEFPVTQFFGSSTGPGMDTRGILAPARDVLSTFYYNREWNPSGRCGSFSSDGTSRGPNYGVCTGTSMATPHITGALGLLRSVNPLLSASQITSALLGAGDNAMTPNTTRGFGVPNVATAVNSVLATTNRLTPLFSQY